MFEFNISAAGAKGRLRLQDNVNSLKNTVCRGSTTSLHPSQNESGGGYTAIRGFIFACTQKSEYECLNRLLFCTDQVYGPIVVRIRQGDLLFLNNVETNMLHGVFKATSDGGFNIQPNVFNGKYPYQVQVQPLGQMTSLTNAKSLLQKRGIKRNTPLFGERLGDFLDLFMPQQSRLASIDRSDSHNTRELITQEKQRIRDSIHKVDVETEIPLVEPTTFWDFPKQSYGSTPKGNNRYPGVTPALIIYNMLWRYTKPGDLVVDPMCGSGTTIDVCKAEKRRAIGYDIAPAHPEVIQNDARSIPLEDKCADMVFIDSPYGNNVSYNTHPSNIGGISSESDEFYGELEKVMKESHRILKEGKALGWLIGDQWVKRKFTPVGFEIYTRLCQYFEPLDIICVLRRGQSSNTGLWLNRARRLNFYLRGFKYLIIVSKSPSYGKRPEKDRKVEWTYYARER